MATTNLDVGSVYVTNGSVSGDVITTSGDEVVVRLSSGSAGPVEHTYDKELIEITRPVISPPATGGSGTPIVSIKDLLKIKELITANGFLEEETSDSGVSKAGRLDTLVKYGGVVTVVWGKSVDSEQQKFVGAIRKLSIKEQPHKIVDTAFSIVTGRPERSFLATVTVLVGEDL